MLNIALFDFLDRKFKLKTYLYDNAKRHTFRQNSKRQTKNMCIVSTDCRIESRMFDLSDLAIVTFLVMSDLSWSALRKKILFIHIKRSYLLRVLCLKFEFPALIIKITISSIVIGLKNSIFHYFTCQVVTGQLVIGQFVIGQFVIGQFNKPITLKAVVKSTNHIQSCSHVCKLACTHACIYVFAA